MRPYVTVQMTETIDEIVSRHGIYATILAIANVCEVRAENAKNKLCDDPYAKLLGKTKSELETVANHFSFGK